MQEESLLWNRFRTGDKSAFEQIYRIEVDFLFNYGMQIFGEEDLVRDCIQDLFVELWKRRKHLGATTSIRFYLSTSLKRRVIRKMQSAERPGQFISLSTETEDFDFVEDSKSKHEALELLSDKLAAAIRHLPERQKQIIQMRFYEGLSAVEIAERLDIGLESTYTLLSRSLKSLKKNAHELYFLLLLLLWR